MNVALPVQSLLFANLAPQINDLQLPGVNEWVVQRNSFDFGDKMLELTPQGYNNYRKQSERLGSPLHCLLMPPPPATARGHAQSSSILFAQGPKPLDE